MKNGPPARAVITPTGASPEPIITLATASLAIRKDAPIIAEVGRRMSLAGVGIAVDVQAASTPIIVSPIPNKSSLTIDIVIDSVSGRTIESWWRELNVSWWMLWKSIRQYFCQIAGKAFLIS